MRRYIPGAACWGSTAPKLPVHRRSPARWRLLACPYWAGRGRPAGRPSESARLPQAVPPPACGWWVSALFERVGKENGAPRSSPDAPASVPSCWLITAFPACVILPQMNHQPMCIWMVKPPFTQYISETSPSTLRSGAGLERNRHLYRRRLLWNEFPAPGCPAPDRRRKGRTHQS